MTKPPDWLPDKICVDPWTNDTYEKLYAVFRRDFVTSRPTYKGRAVVLLPAKEDGRERDFWHVTSVDDDKTGERLPDLERCAKLPWVRPIIKHAGGNEVLEWTEDRGRGGIRPHLWLKEQDFLVVLVRLKSGEHRLVTSFNIGPPHTRAKLQKRYDRSRRT